MANAKPLPVIQEAGWAPGPVWKGAGNIVPRRDSISELFGIRLKLYPFRAPWLLYLVTDVTLITLCLLAHYIFLLVIYTMNVKYLVVRNSPFGLSNGKTPSVV